VLFFINITNKAIAITVRTIFNDWSINPKIKRDPKTVQIHAKTLSQSITSLFGLTISFKTETVYFSIGPNSIIIRDFP